MTHSWQVRFDGSVGLRHVVRFVAHEAHQNPVRWRQRACDVVARAETQVRALPHLVRALGPGDDTADQAFGHAVEQQGMSGKEGFVMEAAADSLEEEVTSLNTCQFRRETDDN